MDRKNNLTDEDRAIFKIIKDYRAKADLFEKIADSLERDFAPPTGMN